jgi:UDP-xylose/UDP-N-acetylglucosamine transporter B4
MNMIVPSTPVLIAAVMIGCCSNVITFELILNEYNKSGSIVTIAQFLFISMEGLIHNSKIERNIDGSLKSIGLKERSTPLFYHALLVSLFFTQTIVNNLAFSYNISLPLHSIFRSGSLITNMLVGMILFHYRYPKGKILSVIAISIGIVLATYSSSQDTGKVFNEEIDYSKWTIGIMMLTAGQFMASLLGNLQQYGYKHYGKDYRENMFYSHVLSLPLFLFLTHDITTSIHIFNTKPILWFYLLLNVLTQYICIRGVYALTSTLGTLSTTLIITVRKFLSILISLIYFDNTFTTLHWIATALVFGGGIAFTLVEEKSSITTTSNSDKKDK